MTDSTPDAPGQPEMPRWRICVDVPMPLDDEQREDLLTAVCDAGRDWEERQGQVHDWDWDLEIYAGPPRSEFGTDQSPESEEARR